VARLGSRPHKVGPEGTTRNPSSFFDPRLGAMLRWPQPDSYYITF